MIDINKTAIENNLAYIVSGIDSNKLIIKGPDLHSDSKLLRSELYCNELKDQIELSSDKGIEEIFTAEEGQLKEKYFHIHDALLNDIMETVDLIYVKLEDSYIHLKDYMEDK